MTTLDQMREERDRALMELATTLDRLPEGMKECFILFRECSVGHGWLTAANWVHFECPTCERDRLTAALATEKSAREKAEAERNEARAAWRKLTDDMEANSVHSWAAACRKAEAERSAARAEVERFTAMLAEWQGECNRVVAQRDSARDEVEALRGALHEAHRLAVQAVDYALEEVARQCGDKRLCHEARVTAESELGRIAALAVLPAPTQSTPPVDNEHVAPGCQPFDEATIAANRLGTCVGHLGPPSNTAEPHPEGGTYSIWKPGTDRYAQSTLASSRPTLDGAPLVTRHKLIECSDCRGVGCAACEHTGSVTLQEGTLASSQQEEVVPSAVHGRGNDAVGSKSTNPETVSATPGAVAKPAAVPAQKDSKVGGGDVAGTCAGFVTREASSSPSIPTGAASGGEELAASQPSPEGSWPRLCVQRAFVEGVRWGIHQSSGFTAFPSEQRAAEDEVARRYGEPRPSQEERFEKALRKIATLAVSVSGSTSEIYAIARAALAPEAKP